MKDNKIFDFSRLGFQEIINIMTKKINEAVDVVNTMIPTLDNYISKIDWNEIINSDLYKEVLKDIAKTNQELNDYAKKVEVANGLTAKGNCLYSALPTSNNKVGDYYYCSDGNGINGEGNYVWNGTSWYFGGNGDNGYTDVNGKIDKLTQVNFQTVTGSYIKHADGKVASYDSMNCSDFIFTLPLSTIIIDLNGMLLNTPDARGLAFYDMNKNYVSGYQYQGGGLIPLIKLSVPRNAYYVRFTFKDTPKVNILPPLQVFSENLFKTINYTNIAKNNCYTGGYINRATGVVTIYGDTLFYTNYLPCEENDYLKLEGINIYNDVRGMAFYDSNKTFITGYQYDNTNKTITVPSGAKYFTLTISSSFLENLKVKYYTKNESNLTFRKIEMINPIDYKGNEINIFTRCVCIGDSLTKGVFNDNSTGTTQYVGIEKYGYPKRLQDLTGVECVNLGQGGHTTKSWYELYKNKDLTDYDMAIINLGANDTVGNNMTPELTETYLQKIVDKLKTSNKGIKIFIATILPAYYSRNTSLYSNVNSKIKNVVNNNEDCYLIDLSLYSQCKDGTNYAEGHLTALGYNKEANELKSMISYVIKNNMDDFKYVHFINSDYSFS